MVNCIKLFTISIICGIICTSSVYADNSARLKELDREYNQLILLKNNTDTRIIQVQAIYGELEAQDARAKKKKAEKAKTVADVIEEVKEKMSVKDE